MKIFGRMHDCPWHHEDVKGSDCSHLPLHTLPPCTPPGGLQILQGDHAGFPLILSQWPIDIIIPRV